MFALLVQLKHLYKKSGEYLQGELLTMEHVVFFIYLSSVGDL